MFNNQYTYAQIKEFVEINYKVTQVTLKSNAYIYFIFEYFHALIDISTRSFNVFEYWNAKTIFFRPVLRIVKVIGFFKIFFIKNKIYNLYDKHYR